VSVSHSEHMNTGARIGRRAKPLSVLDARILEGIAVGESNLQLAGRLHLSRQGIEYRVAAMLRRLRAVNRAALVSRAYTTGLLSVSTWPPKVPEDLVE
jgi:DNA-binding NarL/FixJ family response regulator